MDGLRIRMHPTLDILCREDGAVMLKKGWTFGTKMKTGYRSVWIGDKITGKRYYVHRLICETFHLNPQSKPTVDHIDRNPENNFESNLRWATQSEQNENSSLVLNAADYGVRHKDNPNAYKVAWSHAHLDSKRKASSKYYMKQKSKGLIYSKCSDGRFHWHKPGDDPWLTM